MRILKNNWKFLTILIIMVLLIIMLSNYTCEVSKKLYNFDEMETSENYFKNIEEGMTIKQTFIAKQNNLNKIIINFEPLKEDANAGGKILLGLKDNNGNIVKEETLTRNFFRENSIYEFDFKKQNNSMEQKYEIYVKFLSKEGKEKFISVHYTDSVKENHELFINDEKIEGNLAIQELYKSKEKTIFYYTIEIILIIIVIGILSIIHLKKGMKIENIFLLTVPIIGVFFIIAMPTFKNHDELYHWYRTYEVSTGIFVTDPTGTELPESIRKIATDNWQEINYGTIKEEIKTNLYDNGTSKIYSETDAVYSFVQYIPQAIGAFITRLFTKSALAIAYGARAFNLLFSICMIYLAIKIIPFGKKQMLIASYIPIAIEGFSSMSPDAMTISVAFLFIAYILHLSFSDKSVIRTKEITILLIMSIIISLCKIVYIPLVALMIIIPKEKFKNQNNRNKLITIGIISAVAIVINFAWLKIASQYLQDFREGDSKYQVINIIKDPLNYFNLLIYTLNMESEKYLRTMFGGDLGWGELTRLNALIPYILCGTMLLSTILDNNIKDKFKKYQKWTIILVLITICGLIFTSLYVQWTSVKDISIAGVQGRYFIPILPLATILIGSVIKCKSDYNEEKCVKCIAIICFTIQIYTILQTVICNI